MEAFRVHDEVWRNLGWLNGLRADFQRQAVDFWQVVGAEDERIKESWHIGLMDAIRHAAATASATQQMSDKIIEKYQIDPTSAEARQTRAESLAEANYLAAYLNSGAANEAIKEFQSRGLRLAAQKSSETCMSATGKVR